MRHPAVFLAIVAATAVLSVAASSGVLFTSTLDTASLEAQAAQDCPESSMPGFQAAVPGPDLAAYRAAAVATMGRALRGQQAGRPYAAEIGFVQYQSVTFTLFDRPGALDHVRRLSGGGPGVWLPDSTAETLHLAAGSSLDVGGSVRLRVAGLYRSMDPSPFVLANIPRYFCTWSDLITTGVSNAGSGPFVLSDDASMAHAVQTQLEVYAPLPYGSISLSAARTANAGGTRAGQQFLAGHPNATATENSPTGTIAPADSADAASLATKIERARQARSGISGSVVPIDLAGVLVAMLLVAGAGAFWATHREREIRLLVSRGVGPMSLATKAALEALPAAVVGLVVGSVLGIVVSKAVSPTSVLGPGATTTGLHVAAGAVAVGLLLVAAVGASVSRDRVVGRGARWTRFVPWELLVAAPSVVLWLRVHGHSAVTVNEAIVHVRPELVIYPMVASLAVLLLLGRVLMLVLPAVRRRSRGGGPARYLALRRLAGSRTLVIALALCVALPGALVTYTASLANSVRGEITAKYRTNIGAERVLDVVGVGRGDVDLHGSGTLVSSYLTDPRLPGDLEVAVLGVQPPSFARFALLTDDQRAMVGRLHATDAGAVPAILVNAPSGTRTSELTIRTSRLRLHVVATPAVFPGLRDGTSPLLVVDRAALAHVDTNADRQNQVWTTIALDPVARNVLARAHDTVLDTVSPKLLVTSGGLLPITWIFSYLRALAYLIGLLAVVALVFSLAARTRRRTVSYVLSRRLGLARSAHLRSLLLEIGVVVGLGYVAGILVGTGSVRLILGALDVYPALPPPPALTLPVAVWVVTAVVSVVVVLVAALGVQVLADRARPAEILRLE